MSAHVPHSVSFHRVEAGDIQVGEVIYDYKWAMDTFKAYRLTAIKWREDVQRAQYLFDPVDGQGMGMETAPQFWVYVRRETA